MLLKDKADKALKTVVQFERYAAGLPTWQRIISATKARCYYKLGDLDKAEECADRAGIAARAGRKNGSRRSFPASPVVSRRRMTPVATAAADPGEFCSPTVPAPPGNSADRPGV